MCEVRKDCFGYDQSQNTCRALKGLFCKHEECGFYKTKEQFKADRKLYGDAAGYLQKLGQKNV